MSELRPSLETEPVDPRSPESSLSARWYVYMGGFPKGGVRSPYFCFEGQDWIMTCFVEDRQIRLRLHCRNGPRSAAAPVVTVHVERCPRGPLVDWMTRVTHDLSQGVIWTGSFADLRRADSDFQWKLDIRFLVTLDASTRGRLVPEPVRVPKVSMSPDESSGPCTRTGLVTMMSDERGTHETERRASESGTQTELVTVEESAQTECTVCKRGTQTELVTSEDSTHQTEVVVPGCVKTIERVMSERGAQTERVTSDGGAQTDGRVTCERGTQTESAERKTSEADTQTRCCLSDTAASTSGKDPRVTTRAGCVVCGNSRSVGERYRPNNSVKSSVTVRAA